VSGTKLAGQRGWHAHAHGAVNEKSSLIAYRLKKPGISATGANGVEHFPAVGEGGRLAGRVSPSPPNNEALVQEVISSHVRSLMANHLADVTSTDQHTVKPWFNGKLDYFPRVNDLAGEGFPLVGGRLDYLDGRPVAALVYQRGRHFINLFIWPAKGGSGEKTFSRQGYNVIYWSSSEMAYWAVSDLNPAELQEFMRLEQK